LTSVLINIRFTLIGRSPPEEFEKSEEVLNGRVALVMFNQILKEKKY
jgi:hypothetical protein